MESTQQVFLGDCRTVLPTLTEQSIWACITDPPYNCEFVGHNWDADEITRRTQRARENGSKILVKHIVLDPFAGSGTTLLAEQNLGRSYIGIEIVPDYIPIIERRLLSDSYLVNLPQNDSEESIVAIDLPESLPLFD